MFIRTILSSKVFMSFYILSAVITGVFLLTRAPFVHPVALLAIGMINVITWFLIVYTLFEPIDEKGKVLRIERYTKVSIGLMVCGILIGLAF